MARPPPKFRYWNKRIFDWSHRTKSGKSPLDEIIPNSTILTIELRCIFLFKFRNSNLCSSNRSNAGNFQSAAHPLFHLICLHFLYFLQWKQFSNFFVSLFVSLAALFVFIPSFPIPAGCSDIYMSLMLDVGGVIWSIQRTHCRQRSSSCESNQPYCKSLIIFQRSWQKCRLWSFWFFSTSRPSGAPKEKNHYKR